MEVKVLVDWRNGAEFFLSIVSSFFFAIIVLFLRPDTFPGVVKGVVGGIVAGTVTFSLFIRTDAPEIFSITITLVVSLGIFLYQYMYSKNMKSDDEEKLPLISPRNNEG